MKHFKVIRLILWSQVLAGVVGACLAAGEIYGSVTGLAAVGRLKQDHSDRRLPEYSGDLLDRLESASRGQASLAVGWWLTCAGMILFAAVPLWWMAQKAPVPAADARP